MTSMKNVTMNAAPIQSYGAARTGVAKHINALVSDPNFTVAAGQANPLSIDLKELDIARLKARLESDPEFAAVIALIDKAKSDKEAARGLLSSGDNLDEQQMAFYTQANKESDQLLQVTTNLQKANNDTADNFVRNT